MSFGFDELKARLNTAEQWRADSSGQASDGLNHAAVLVLMTDEPDPRMTFIERSQSLRNHAGQIAFPGGGLEPEDSGPTAAALREANEEVGLDPSRVTVLGQLPVATIPVSSFDVTPVVGTWDGSEELVPHDSGEVASVFQVAISELVNPARRITAFHPAGYRGPAWQLGDLFLWGFTAQLLDHTLRIAGWERDWDTENTVRVPARFMRR